jgi:hypothetical protein
MKSSTTLGTRRCTVGRPITLKGPWEKITVDMFDRHAAGLDMMRVRNRLRHRRAASRAELVRALIDFMHGSGIDFTRFETADEMTACLTAHFQKIRTRHRKFNK